MYSTRDFSSLIVFYKWFSGGFMRYFTFNYKQGGTIWFYYSTHFIQIYFITLNFLHHVFYPTKWGAINPHYRKQLPSLFFFFNKALFCSRNETIYDTSYEGYSTSDGQASLTSSPKVCKSVEKTRGGRTWLWPRANSCNKPRWKLFSNHCCSTVNIMQEEGCGF